MPLSFFKQTCHGRVSVASTGDIFSDQLAQWYRESIPERNNQFCRLDGDIVADICTAYASSMDKVFGR